ncbi:DUF1826 domain-containing protein [Paracoccus seriniphilus]|uniref:DUF1826 domain-containing protein n=1 Tax=Paracoccus seriniphilus TaxID=184748 RepID=A0A239PQV4_9RHOB|nr:DUF1826 domain-containing protein [Paracoccus seriniphilus]WCR12891.1 DUF1826 domain-containing protein [Paracoccus seriniphilus]SNT72684.1 Protein of unknown function [Paracoccus seriniphilus]
MTTVLPSIAAAVNSSSDPQVLLTIGTPGVSLALWNRSLNEDLASPLDLLPADRLPRLRRRLGPASVAGAVHEACEATGAGACAALLAADVEALAAHAMRVFTSPLLEIRLDVTEGQPCPKWHVDAVPGRLLCTLRGPGTEYGAVGPDVAPRSIHRMARGAVGLFRGKLWPGQGRAAILHRSPPRDAGSPRLLVVIDPAGEAEIS